MTFQTSSEQLHLDHNFVSLYVTHPVTDHADELSIDLTGNLDDVRFVGYLVFWCAHVFFVCVTTCQEFLEIFAPHLLSLNSYLCIAVDSLATMFESYALPYGL